MSDVQRELERRIRKRATFLWFREGRPEGRADEHWRAAQQAPPEEEPRNVRP